MYSGIDALNHFRRNAPLMFACHREKKSQKLKEPERRGISRDGGGKFMPRSNWSEKKEGKSASHACARALNTRMSACASIKRGA